MMIETLGDAYTHSVQAVMACAERKGDGMKKHRECVFRRELDMMTLVATRGRDFPMALLADRLRCPSCGSRRIRMMWNFPSGTHSNRVAAP